MVLLLHAGDHIQHRVQVVGGCCHGQAARAPRRAVDKQVVRWQRHVQPGKHERHPRHNDRLSVASVESSKGGDGGLPYSLPELIPHRLVRRSH